jgi:thiol-disulfide isomerase/thioredoxin
MKRRLSEYKPNRNSIDKLERIDQKHHLIVFSADWCGDCVAYVPGLAKTLIMAKNNMLQARVVDYDAYRDLADEFNVRAIPTIIVYDKTWREIGRFVETPRKYGTVEEEVCAILDSNSSAKA